jgi:ABC-type nitrate/sulfonate/bicarbonate transport system permease component
MKLNKIKEYIPSIILSAIIFFVWQEIVQFGLVSSHILPSPISIFLALIQNIDLIAIHSVQTLKEALIGLFFSAIVGVLVAIMLDSSSLTRKAVYPLLISSQTIPIIALAPLLLVWFGFDALPKIIIVVLFCFFPIVIATVSGFAQINPDLLKLLKSMDAGKWQILWKVKIPGALPQFFSGLKIAATYSVTGAIVGEYVGAYQGLGIYLQQMAHAYAIDVVFAIIAVIAILSIGLFMIVLFLEKIFTLQS